MAKRKGKRVTMSNAVTVEETREALPAVVKQPTRTPRYLREFVREQYADTMLTRLFDIASGEAQFRIPVAVPGGGKDFPPHVEMVDAEAPAMVQTIAAKALIEVAIPKQMGLVDGDDKGTGVILVPAMETRDAEDADFEVVEEEIGPESDARLEDRDIAPGPIEETATVNPVLVQRVLAKRNGKNGKH